jgi:hypothetical protein
MPPNFLNQTIGLIHEKEFAKVETLFFQHFRRSFDPTYLSIA